jgi:hypothetical protein
LFGWRGLVIACAVFLAFENRASRNLALATGALGGGVVAFLIQARFELMNTSRSDFISLSYTFDRQKKELRQWDYHALQGEMGYRINTEVELGRWIFTAKPEMDEATRKKAVSDLAIFSILAFFGTVERDWQWSQRQYSSPVLGFAVMASLSKPSECSAVLDADLRAKLRQAGNLFADAPVKLSLNGICLPKGTSLDITDSEVLLQNPILKLSFKLEDPGGAVFVEPDSRMASTTLADGRPRFETYYRGLSILTAFSGLRANHPLRARYEEWAKRIVQRAAQWFACC